MLTIKPSEALCRKMVEVKYRYVQKQPANLSIQEKAERVKALTESIIEVLGFHPSDFYPQ